MANLSVIPEIKSEIALLVSFLSWSFDMNFLGFFLIFLIFFK